LIWTCEYGVVETGKLMFFFDGVDMKRCGYLFVWMVLQVGVVLSTAMGADFPRLIDCQGQQQIQLTEHTAAFPVGLYVMMRPEAVLKMPNRADAPVIRIASRPFVQAIALGISMADMHPNEGDPISFEVLEKCLRRLDQACQQAGRTRPLPVFYKPYLEHMPLWMMNPDVPESDKPQLVTNRLGMQVIRMPARRSPTGKALPARDQPISTCPVYQQYIRHMVAKLGAWLTEHDPDALRIPLIHFVGPAMNSNQMRTPLPGVFPNQGDDALGVGWTKQKHLDAWCHMTDTMDSYPAFAKRCWVFNMTNLAGSPKYPKAMKLSTAEQSRVMQRLEKSHPDGASAIIVKTESLCVNFDRRQSTNPYAQAPKADFRRQMIEDPDGKPYDLLARRQFGHAWENWSALHPNRDDRAPSLYPLNQLVHNALYLDSPTQPQGTLWVEIWTNEAVVPDVKRFDNSTEPLSESLLNFDIAIRSAIEQLISKK
tara:strand:- start:429 stop:1874 length:1446 start_codon:yes stop_codon:yes gene_type:complete